MSRSTAALNYPYMELEFEDAPLALIGDYFRGTTVDSAYNSGLNLAKKWTEKYAD